MAVHPQRGSELHWILKAAELTRKPCHSHRVFASIRRSGLSLAIAPPVYLLHFQPSVQ